VRYNIYGNEISTSFELNEAKKSVSNPYASFTLKNNDDFYVFGGNVKDEELRVKLTKESNFQAQTNNN
jgi:hypothetical protein